MKCLKAVLVPARLTESHKTFTVLDASNEAPIGFLAYYREAEKPWRWMPYHEPGACYRMKNPTGLRRHGINARVS